MISIATNDQIHYLTLILQTHLQWGKTIDHAYVLLHLAGRSVAYCLHLLLRSLKLWSPEHCFTLIPRMAICYHGNAISICSASPSLSTELKEVPFPPYFLLLWCPSCYCLRPSRSGRRPISLPSFSKAQAEAGGEGGQGCDLPQSEFITQPLSLSTSLSFSLSSTRLLAASISQGRERAAA